ncbi:MULTISPECIES: P-type conjugative transfer protein TrbJ [Burkholderia]|uniref:P-type conjugative transfer protein TrbJ n=1 Tax=Burkholderia TaxID=32008 RepID=UPI000977D698|nr:MULTISPECIES: P-type conjugative transfer protein TrbJ [Burkholderia]MCS6496773.1 P-type conjugative transfer protein TrbJ [Burkholderia thailandensis]MCW3585108.1 P-type conjugative transfer protein TrbJ [Burkholderia cenocepacia]MCW3630430.1 P-type conjugative transfer protein TrbJ [Burkholderia cenocepacia]MCW5178714.1 P-type conjugative transfer protein TrbJ [Burkholderia cenocepacia]NGO96557.1 P-type conjugative transfer protein TrbJ [Burkholderia cenocepacia]
MKFLMRFAISLFIGLTLASRANAGGAVAGATEPTQILNNLQLVASYAQQAQQTVTQINQYETMLRNLMNMSPSALLGEAAGALWNDNNMSQAFKNLQTIVVAGQKIDYTLQNSDQLFRNLHPGYGSALDFQHAYRNWSDNTLSAVQNSLAVMHAHMNDFSNEQSMIAQLQQRSQSAQGQLQALQAGNDVGVAMVGQLEKLRQLQMAQMQSQNAYLATQMDKENMGNTGLAQVYGNIRAKRILPYTAPSLPSN